MLFCVKDVANLRQNGSILGAKKQKDCDCTQIRYKIRYKTRYTRAITKLIPKMYICILLFESFPTTPHITKFITNKFLGQLRPIKGWLGDTKWLNWFLKCTSVFYSLSPFQQHPTWLGLQWLNF